MTGSTDYERMGSPPPTVRCAGGTIEVDGYEGIHVFDEATGRLLETRRQFRDENNHLYSLDICECGHPVHTEKCMVEYWSEPDPYEHCAGCTCFDDDPDAGGRFYPCGCEAFKPHRLGPWDAR